MKDLPIACSLDGQAQELRGDEWREFLTGSLVDRMLIPGGVRFVLPSAPGIRRELERLIALEGACCAWINWDVQESDVIRVDATAEQEAGERQLREWFGPTRSIASGIGRAHDRESPAAPTSDLA